MSLLGGIIGHKRVIEVLERMIKNDSLPHAMLFVGPEHVGKTTAANRLIQGLFCQTTEPRLKPGATPSGQGVQPDYVELKRETDEKTGKRKTNISVKQVRELVGRLAMTSMSGGYKVVFIEEAHRLSLGGVNALLKTLEEPRGKALFILRAPHVDAVPATIASRCQVFRFSTVVEKEIVDGLMKSGIDKEDATLAATHAMGRPGLALRFIKDGEYRARAQTATAQAEEFFAASLPRRLAMVMELIPKGEGDGATALRHIVNDWQNVCRAALMDRLGVGASIALRGLSQDQLVDRLNRLSAVRSALSHNGNPHLALEHLAL